MNNSNGTLMGAIRGPILLIALISQTLPLSTVDT